MPLVYHKGGNNYNIYHYAEEDLDIQDPPNPVNPLVGKMPVKTSEGIRYVGIARLDHPYASHVRIRFRGSTRALASVAQVETDEISEGT